MQAVGDAVCAEDDYRGVDGGSGRVRRSRPWSAPSSAPKYLFLTLFGSRYEVELGIALRQLIWCIPWKLYEVTMYSIW